MKISQLYIYPIKSLRPTSVTSALITKTGFAHDRQFMLLKVMKAEDGTSSLKNMHVTHHPEMSLFTTSFRYSDTAREVPTIVSVVYTPPKESNSSRSPVSKTLELSLFPETKGLDVIDVSLHGTHTSAYLMPSEYADWFSKCMGYDVVLAYIGPHSRGVLGTLSPNKNGVIKARNGSGAGFSGGLFSNIKSIIGYGQSTQTDSGDATISFADCANFLVVTEESLADASRRLPEGENMDITKFRPNIVLSGSERAWDEDYWGDVTISEQSETRRSKILFTANCVRCASLNVDYETGAMGKGEAGSILKKLQADRRVDQGAKYSPVFGRYGYLESGLGNSAKVDDRVVVGSRNSEHDSFDWPGLAGVPKAPVVA